jgi:hypothetical protein
LVPWLRILDVVGEALREHILDPDVSAVGDAERLEPVSERHKAAEEREREATEAEVAAAGHDGDVDGQERGKRVTRGKPASNFNEVGVYVIYIALNCDQPIA